MLKFNYKDLIRLRTLVARDPEESSQHLLKVIDQEILKTPEFLVPLTWLTSERDILYCTEREIEQRMRKLSSQVEQSNKYSALIYCEHSQQARFVYQRILSLLDAKSASHSEMGLQFRNGATLKLISGRTNPDAARGRSYDMVIVFTYDDVPSA